MSKLPESSTVFWDRLLAIADVINDTKTTDGDASACLLGIEEGFSEQFDPADHYQEYVVLLLCRAMRRRFERVSANETGK